MFNNSNWDETKKALLESLSSSSPAMQNALDSQSEAIANATTNIADFRKVMIPMIRRIIPGIVASDILMGGAARRVTMSFPGALIAEVTTPSRQVSTKIQDWLRDSIGEKCYHIDQSDEYYPREFTVHFTNECDMVALKMTWDSFQET